MNLKLALQEVLECVKSLTTFGKNYCNWPFVSHVDCSKNLPDVTGLPNGLQAPRVSYTPNIHAINDAHKVTKTALSALSFEDVPTALKFLNKAIELLTVPGAQK